MTRILAPTSKVGFYTNKTSVTEKTYFRDGSLYMTQTFQTTTGLSYKGPTHGSDGHQPTNYSRSILRAVGESYEITYGNTGMVTKGTNSFGNWLGMSTAPWAQFNLASGSVSPSSYLRDQAISNAVKKLHGENAYILEDLAQAGKTAKQAWDIFKRIVQSTGKYLAALYEAIAFWEASFGAPKRHGGPGKGRRSNDAFIRDLANSWLAWYYGIKPLISTLNALGSNQKPRIKTIKVKSKASGQLNPSGLYSQTDPSGTNYVYSGECREETTCCLICDITMSDNLAKLAQLGFRGGHDPFVEGDEYGGVINDSEVLLLAWALMPYSFVIDWIIPVETFLRSLVWSPALTYKGGYITDWMGGTAKCSAVSGAFNYKGNMPKGRIEALLFQRETYNSYPPPVGLSVQQSLTTTNSFNALALLTQALLK